MTNLFALYSRARPKHDNFFLFILVRTTKKSNIIYKCFCCDIFHVDVLLLSAKSNNKKIVILYTILVCYGWAGLAAEPVRFRVCLTALHLNDGSLTSRAALPPRSSAIDLTMCSADMALNDILWHVLDDAGGSDHLPILTSL
jgi:hypothetical protein